MMQTEDILMALYLAPVAKNNGEVVISRELLNEIINALEVDADEIGFKADFTRGLDS